MVALGIWNNVTNLVHVRFGDPVAFEECGSPSQSIEPASIHSSPDLACGLGISIIKLTCQDRMLTSQIVDIDCDECAAVYL